MHRVILHMDMDAFYASVEQRDRPELRGRPVIVGSPPTQRGVVCAASYEARKFGVRSAMPSVTAGRLCPDGVFLRPRMTAYQAESREIMAIVQEFAGDRVQQVSIDEAYLDVSEACQGDDADASLERAMPVARSIKETVRSRRGLTTSVGVASNKLLAKLASDLEKPDGLTVIREREKVAILRPLPVRALHGVGEAFHLAVLIWDATHWKLEVRVAPAGFNDVHPTADFNCRGFHMPPSMKSGTMLRHSPSVSTNIVSMPCSLRKPVIRL